MSKRKAISERMKIDCLLWLANCLTPGKTLEDQATVLCPECGVPIMPSEPIQWDHRHAVGLEGPHEYQNLRPVHVDCHKAKTARDVKAMAKADRINGTTGTRGDKFAVRKRPIDEIPPPKPRFGRKTFERAR